MAAKTLTEADVARIVATAIRDALAEYAPAPVAQAPVKPQAKSAAFGDRTFSEYVNARKAAQVPCAIDDHAPIEVDGETVLVCNRKFSPKSSGVTNHTPRIV